jgi:hypothetical protein
MAKTKSGKKSSKSKPRRKLAAKCAGHANHMCELSNRREMGKVAKLAKGAVHVCYVCGRAAVKPANLCDPILI